MLSRATFDALQREDSHGRPLAKSQGRVATIRSAVAESREHTGVPVVQKVAVQRPPAWIVGIECDSHGRLLWDQHRVAQRAGNATFTNSHNLKRVPVQMDRV